MRKKLGVFLIALFAISMTAWAQDAGTGPGGPGGPPPMEGHGHGPHGPGPQFWKNSDMVTKLNLSTTQVTQLDQAFSEHKPNLKTDMTAMRTADTALHTLLDQDNPDQTQVTTAVNQVLAARGTLERETTMMMLDFRKVLTAEQWKQLRAMHPMGPGFGGDRKWGQRGGRHGQSGPNQAPPPAGGDDQAPPPPQD